MSIPRALPKRYTKFMPRELISSDNPILKKPAAAVAKPADVVDLANDLLATMVAEGGVGLAAPQVGVSVRVFVTGVDGEQLVCINPQLVGVSEKQVPWEEGCLSLPRLLGEVIRPAEVEVEYTDLKGTVCRRKADKLLARVFQHELDHLDGILFPDRVDDRSKLRVITEEEWQSRFETAAKAPE